MSEDLEELVDAMECVIRDEFNPRIAAKRIADELWAVLTAAREEAEARRVPPCFGADPYPPA
jgi:hypothetical protein